MGHVIAFSLTAALNPTLLTATTVMLLLERPARLMVGYLLGAYLISVTAGLLIVHALHHHALTKTTQHTLSPAANLGLGAIALIAAYALHSGRVARRRARRRAKKADAAPPRWQRELSKGSARTTFVIGIFLTLPGASFIAAMDAIHDLNTTAFVSVLLVITATVIQLVLIEVPLVGFALSPEKTQLTINRAKAYAQTHGTRLATRVLAVIGVALIVRGVLELTL